MQRVFLIFAAFFALIIGISTPTNAADIYLHSGDKLCVHSSDDCSVMSVGTLDDGTLVITYLRAREGLERVGVVTGTLLVSGVIRGNRFYGQATRFSKVGRSTCSARYNVTGTIVPGQDIELEGAAPVFAENECRVVRYTRDSSQARLFFLYMGNANEFRSTSN